MLFLQAPLFSTTSVCEILNTIYLYAIFSILLLKLKTFQVDSDLLLSLFPQSILFYISEREYALLLFPECPQLDLYYHGYDLVQQDNVASWQLCR